MLAPLTLQGYREFFGASSGASPWPSLANSVTASVFSTLLVLVLALPAAYALSIRPVRKWTDVMFFFLSTKMMPIVAGLLPLYLFAQKAGLLDNIWLLVIFYTSMNLPIAVWMLRSFLAEVPVEMLEAASMDGAGCPHAAGVLAPVVMPGIAATALICFIFSWNELLFARVLTATVAQTAPVFLTGFVTSQGLFLAKVCAASLVVSLPVLDRRLRRPGQAGAGPVAGCGQVTPTAMRASVLNGVGDVVRCGTPGPRATGRTRSWSDRLGRRLRIRRALLRARTNRALRRGPPLVLGHEAGGEVVATGGAAVTRLELGQRVSIEPGVPCRPASSAWRAGTTCARTSASSPRLPTTARSASTSRCRRPSSTPYRTASATTPPGCIEPLSVGHLGLSTRRGLPGIARARSPAPDRSGWSRLQAALAYGATEVVVSDVNPQRLALAERAGATATVDVVEGAAGRDRRRA